MVMDDTTLKFLGDLISSLAIIIAAVIALWQYKRVRFFESVTNSRKEYLKTFRDYSVEFCRLTDYLIKNKEIIDKEWAKQIEYAYKLKMMLNPFDYAEWWDGEIMRLMDNLLMCPNDKELRQLTALLQSACILEWKGITKEGTSGVIGEKAKEKLRIENYEKYIFYCKKNNYEYKVY